uniref:Uncharacterized protein n=1 Tax=Anopheles maculatus TaxID=74869 RepID=A0A182T408_9DIPT
MHHHNHNHHPHHHMHPVVDGAPSVPDAAVGDGQKGSKTCFREANDMVHVGGPNTGTLPGDDGTNLILCAGDGVGGSSSARLNSSNDHNKINYLDRDLLGLDPAEHHHASHHHHGIDESSRTPVINSVHSHHQHNPGPGATMNGPITLGSKDSLHLPSSMMGDEEASFHEHHQQQQEQQQQQQQQEHHHHHHHHHQQHHQQTIHELHQFNHISFDTMGVPTFEEDISRQVQNAIDSILNLQANETDGSLHYSLDHSFLPDSPLSAGLGNSVNPSPLGAIHHQHPEAPLSSHHLATHLPPQSHAQPQHHRQSPSISAVQQQQHVGMKRKYPPDSPNIV